MRTASLPELGRSETAGNTLMSLFPPHPLRWAVRVFAVYVLVGVLGAAVTYGLAVIPNSPIPKLLQEKSVQSQEPVQRQEGGLNKPVPKT